MHTDLAWLRAYPDQHTAELIDETLELLGRRRGYLGPFILDPTVRLHLLESLHRQLNADLATTIHHAGDLGYTAEQIHQILHP